MSSSSSQDSGEPRGLLYVLLAAFAIFSGWSLSKLNTPSKEGSKPVTLTDYTQEEHTPCRFDPSLIQPITQTSKQGDYTEEHKRSTPLWEQTMTGAVAVGTIGLLIVNVFALHSAKEAANSTKQQLEDSEAVQRAQLTLENFQATIVPGKDFVANVSITVKNNGGNTVANNISFTARWGSDSPGRFRVNLTSASGGSSLGHDKSRTYQFTVGRTSDSTWDGSMLNGGNSMLNPSLVGNLAGSTISTGDVMQGKKLFFIYPTVHYRDIFGREGIASDCFAYSTDTRSWIACPPLSE